MACPVPDTVSVYEPAGKGSAECNELMASPSELLNASLLIGLPVGPLSDHWKLALLVRESK